LEPGVDTARGGCGEVGTMPRWIPWPSRHSMICSRNMGRSR